MSINSIFKTMATADKLSIPEIMNGIKSGSIPSYVGVPLLEKKTKDAQKLQMAQAIMRQLEGGPPSTVSDQVMQAADQVTRPVAPPSPAMPATDRQQPAPPMGIDAAQSNMPQEYAGGGIVAFADTGLVTNPDDVIPGRRDSAPTRAAGATDDQYVNDPYFGLTTPIWDADVLRQRRFFKSLGQDEPTARMQRPAPLENAPFKFSDAEPLPNTRLKTSEMSPLPNARLDDGFKAFLDAGAKQPPATPASPPAAGPKYDIERGLNTPPPAAPQTPRESAFSGIEDLYKSYLDRGRADRDELRSLILGQKADRAEQEAENRNTALMKAGFGMMAGQSPFAGVNIGRGAMEGVESYGKGLEQLRRDDRSTIQQLASLGLKGQELEQAAMKMGIDMSHYKMLEPYYQSGAAENYAKAGLYPAQAELYGAESAHQLASANEATMRTALLPGEQDIKRLKQVAAGYKGTPGAGQFMSKLQEWRRGAYVDPASSGVMFDAEITKGLTYPKDSGTYQRALAGARAAIDDAFAQNVREFQYVGGSREGSSSSSE